MTSLDKLSNLALSVVIGCGIALTFLSAAWLATAIIKHWP